MPDIHELNLRIFVRLNPTTDNFILPKTTCYWLANGAFEFCSGSSAFASLHACKVQIYFI